MEFKNLDMKSIKSNRIRNLKLLDGIKKPKIESEEISPAIISGHDLNSKVLSPRFTISPYRKPEK